MVQHSREQTNYSKNFSFPKFVEELAGMSLQSMLNPATADPSTMAAQDRLTVIEQPKPSSGLFRKEPVFGAQPFAFGAQPLAFGAQPFASGTPTFKAPALFGARPNPAPVTAQPSGSVKIFGNGKD